MLMMFKGSMYMSYQDIGYWVNGALPYSITYSIII